MDKPFVLYASCIPVKGFKQSIIVDLQRQNIFHIPNSLYDLLIINEGKSISNVCGFYNNQYDDIIKEYFKFLIKNDIVFFADNIDNFPKMDLTWESPFGITNCIIDINSDSNHDFANIFEKIEKVSCPHIQIRSYSIKDINYFSHILNLLEDSRILSIELIIKYFRNLIIDDLEQLIIKYPRIFNIIVHSAPKTECISLKQEKMGNIFYVDKEISSSKDCGCISTFNFIINTKTFTESLKFNSCLNRKISIDCNGFIKNCPSMEDNFGHIRTMSLKEVISSKEFQKLWYIKKDEIKVCRDCEYRYVCTDCRAYIKDPNDIYSQPAKCNYNPYIAKWKGQDGYVTVEEWQKNRENK